MKANQTVCPVVRQGRLLAVSPSGYDAWLKRAPSARAQANAALTARIEAIHAQSRGTYGMPRLHAELVAQGERVSPKRIARLMRAAGLQGVSRRQRAHTTHGAP